jgi:MOSC domain-containing protein YiiM
VAADGHPIFPGSCGENLTTEGIELSTLPVGARLAIGERLVLELASPDGPCETIEDSFSDRRSSRINIDLHPTDSRMYARVIEVGQVSAGDPITVLPTPAESRAQAQLELAWY